MNAIRRALFAFTVGAALLVSAAAPTFAASRTVIYVDDDGTASRTSCNGTRSVPSTLADAVDHADPNTTIRVCPGTYVGRIDVSDKPNIKIIAVKRWHARVVSASDHPTNNALIHALNSPGFVIRGMRMMARTQAPCGRVGSMIAVNNSPNSRVLSNHIEPLGTQSLGDCGFLVGAAVPSSDGTRVLWNKVKDFIESGIDVSDSDNVIVRKNRLNYFHASYSSTAVGGIGILLNLQANNVRIVNNKIRGLASGGISTPRFSNGIEDNSTPALLKNNKMAHLDRAVQLLSLEGGRVQSNYAVDGVGGGVAFFFTSGVELLNNRFNTSGYGAYVSTESVDNNLHDNDFDGTFDTDCRDDSGGSGTAGTANTWTNNNGGASDPVGICGPQI